MKKIFAMAAVAALAAGASAYGANPFADVATSVWAYQAVSDLSAQGIVEGYPDGTFKGQTNITRYEMAQIVARLMAKEDQYNAEQRATIDKLAGEYADELDSLGVKVSNLEKKVGNISWSGDARMRYQRGLDSLEMGSLVYSKTYQRKDKYDGRIRLNVTGEVNDKVSVVGRFLTNMDFKEAGEDDGDTRMDRLHVVYTPNEKASIDVGRTDLWLGQTGILYDDTFDGIKATYDNGHFSVEAGYGRLIEMSLQGKWYLAADASDMTKMDSSNLESYYVKIHGNTGPIELSAFYLDFVQNASIFEWYKSNKLYNGATDFKMWGVGTAIQLGDHWKLDGDYIQNPENYPPMESFHVQAVDKPTLWTVGLTYGKVDTNRPGTYSIGLRYVDADELSYLGSSTLDMTDYLDASFDAISAKGMTGFTAGAKFWVAKAGVAVAKNVELDAYYYFNGKAKQVLVGDKKDFDDIYGIELNYTF